MDELGRELEELRRYKIDVETGVRSPSGSISELPGRYQDLQSEIHKLKEVSNFGFWCMVLFLTHLVPFGFGWADLRKMELMD